MDALATMTVVIPVYNQAERLREVAERCLAEYPKLLVVDDGSDEPVASLLIGLDVEVLRHDVNQGKGVALHTAAKTLLERGETHMITLDADGQHLPEDLPRFMEAIKADPKALVIGVRDFESAEVPGLSRFGRSFGNFWVRVQTGQWVGDIQSGFRAYPLILFEELSCLCKRYSLEVEMVVRAAWGGVPIRQVDIQVYYAPAEERSSHFDKLWDNVRVSLLNTHLTMRAFLPWPHRQIGEKPEKITIWHPLRSIRKLLAERTKPHELGLAVALGIFLGALPLIAVHTLLILIAATLFRLNRVTAVAASQICMPPLVPALCIEVGYYMRFGHFLTLDKVDTLRDVSFLEVGHMGIQRLWDWFLGSLVVGTALALAFGLVTYLVALGIERGRRYAK